MPSPLLRSETTSLAGLAPNQVLTHSSPEPVPVLDRLNLGYPTPPLCRLWQARW